MTLAVVREDAAAGRRRLTLADLRRREEHVRRIRTQKADPVRRALLEGALAGLGIPDPSGHLAGSLARYSIDAILRAWSACGATRTSLYNFALCDTDDTVRCVIAPSGQEKERLRAPEAVDTASGAG